MREIDVANDFPRNGPSGWYSHAWMSRALQSLTSTTPKTWSRKAEVGTGSPSALPTPTTKPSSSSMSSRRVGPKVGSSAPGGFVWPHGRARSGAADDDGAGAAVVADRKPAPVRQQRLGVGPEQAAEVRRVLERGVEVDVVGDLERQAQRRVLERHEIRSGADELAMRATVSSQAARPSARNGLSDGASNTAPRPCAARSRTPCADPEPDPRLVAVDREDAEADAPVTRAASQGLELLDRLEEAAAPDRVEELAAHTGELRGAGRTAAPARTTPRRARTPPVRVGERLLLVAGKTTAASRLRKPCSPFARTAWCSPAVALNTRLALATRADEARQLLVARNVAPPQRTFALSPRSTSSSRRSSSSPSSDSST